VRGQAVRREHASASFIDPRNTRGGVPRAPSGFSMGLIHPGACTPARKAESDPNKIEYRINFMETEAEPSQETLEFQGNKE
jgi:hypothetical protein